MVVFPRSEKVGRKEEGARHFVDVQATLGGCGSILQTFGPAGSGVLDARDSSSPVLEPTTLLQRIVQLQVKQVPHSGPSPNGSYFRRQTRRKWGLTWATFGLLPTLLILVGKVVMKLGDHAG